MDDWDLIDEVDVIALWPSEHKKNVESAKWQERKEALEIIIHDSNINVVIAALKVVAKVASGLRNRFACFVPMVSPYLKAFIFLVTQKALLFGLCQVSGIWESVSQLYILFLLLLPPPLFYFL
ncbi:unnamed protein product [Nippostrongylus brasiliensis]|uniref:ARM repeat superfamily protein n=1 Tax=Nippostrongylus brasiliensis TaxID=27835 RepID=A0A0N4YB03_NIPBR|nr:unnamed protein product [Nippostrongylus brasiliensis]